MGLKRVVDACHTYLVNLLKSVNFMPKALLNHLKLLKEGNLVPEFPLKHNVTALLGKDLTGNETWADHHQIASSPGENLW